MKWAVTRTARLLPSMGMAITMAWVSGCGGGGGSGSTGTEQPALSSPYPAAAASCAVNDQRAWLRDYMNDQYFWSDRQGAALDTASTMAQYFNSLLYSGVDRFSSSQPTEQFLEFFREGKRIGYGYSLAWADAAQTQLTFRLVEPLSPLFRDGGIEEEEGILAGIHGLSGAVFSHSRGCCQRAGKTLGLV